MKDTAGWHSMERSPLRRMMHGAWCIALGGVTLIGKVFGFLALCISVTTVGTNDKHCKLIRSFDSSRCEMINQNP